MTQSKTLPPSGDSIQNPAKRYYRPGLDIVRFLAFMLVFFWHTLPMPTKSLVVRHNLAGAIVVYKVILNSSCFGLCLFFTLSAFLIFELLLREKRVTGTVAIKRFYLRRILRIWPLYYLGLALGICWAFTFDRGGSSVQSLAWFVVFAGSFQFVIEGLNDNPAGVLWSISIEEQFYVIAPFLVKHCSRRVLLGFCALVVAVSNLTLFVLAGKTVAPIDVTWTNPLVQFECFAAGILLCLVLNGKTPNLRTGKRSLAVFVSAVSWLVAGNLFYAIAHRTSHSVAEQL